MLGIKIPIKKTEPVKKYIVKNGFLNKNCKIKKTKGFIIFPVEDDNVIADKVKSRFSFVKVIKTGFDKLNKTTDYKDLLKNKLTKKEFNLLPSAFDVIGDIIVIEIPYELNKKPKISKLIGAALLKTHKNIKTVLKKKGSHEGVFRIQKMQVIAGENKKQAIYRENNIILKLDIEKVYFSSRLGTERKRINKLVKQGEEVLVMFSGCGPYVLNIAKNTKAADIYGVEINPTAHKYAIINKVLNKTDNAHFINGDVKKVVPVFYKYIIGLKSSDQDFELIHRTAEHPILMEFHLFDDNLNPKKIKILEKRIEKLKKKHMDIFIHMPFRVNVNGELKKVNITRKDPLEEFKMIDILGNLCIKHNIRAIVHPAVDFNSMESKFNEKTWIYNFSKLRKYFDYFHFETIYRGPFSDYNEIIKIGKRIGIKNICIDLAHMYKHYKNNKKIIKGIKELKKYFRTYFHLSDSTGDDEGLIIGDGKIDFEKILPLVNKGITEVKSEDECFAREMLRAYKKVEYKHKNFDRILMPLPKSAENFLGVALKSIKKKGVIHFYDFLHENDIPDKAVKKIDKACKKLKKKYKVLKWVKCGQHSPRTFRICVDFKVLN